MMSQLIVLLLLLYLVSLFGISRRRRAAPLPAPGGLFFVFVIPCLNEEEVIGPTLESLLALPGEDYAVLVVDDGSDDATPDVVRRFESERVALFRRELPAARQG